MNNVVCKWFGSKYRVHCENIGAARIILSWIGTEFGAEYYYPDRHREMDVLVPGKMHNRVAELLGLPEKRKSPGRVAAGQKQAQTNSKYRFLRRSESKTSP